MSAGRVVLTCDFHRHYSAMLAAGLDRAGAEVTLVTRDHDLEFGGVPGAADVFVRETIGEGVDLRLVEGRVRSPRGWRQALSARAALRRGGEPIVHLQDSVGNDIRLLVASAPRRGRFAITIHDPVRHPGDSDESAGIRWNRRLIMRAGLIFVHAAALRDELIEIHHPEGEIVVIPHGIDPGEPEPLPGRPNILFFGRIARYKGLDVLLDAMAGVWERLPEATLTIAGDGEIEPHEALEDPRVKVENGHIPEEAVPGLFNSSSCVVLPYRQASQSGVGSRVKPFARPLIVTDLGGLPELVEDGSGLIVPPEDAGSLARALVDVLSDRDLSERLGAAGAATARRTASWDAVAGLTLEAYREHLGIVP